MNLLQELKKCESSITQIAKDAGVARQAVYLWKNDRMPREEVFKRLLAIDKYCEVLGAIDYAALRVNLPYGRKFGSKTKNKA